MQKILVCALLAAGCGGGQKQAPPPGPVVANEAPAEAPPPAPAKDIVETMVDEMRIFRDRFCACHDAPCAQHVSEDLNKWGQQMQAKYKDNVKANEEQTQRATELGTQMAECMQKAMGGGAGGGTGSGSGGVTP